LTADAIATLVSAADQAVKQADRFDGPALDAPGGRPTDVMTMTDAQLRQAIIHEFTSRDLAPPPADRLDRLVSEVRGGRRLSDIGKSLEKWKRDHGLAAGGI